MTIRICDLPVDRPRGAAIRENMSDTQIWALFETRKMDWLIKRRVSLATALRKAFEYVADYFGISPQESAQLYRMYQ
jgi:hypothetical protein